MLYYYYFYILLGYNYKSEITRSKRITSLRLLICFFPKLFFREFIDYHSISSVREHSGRTLAMTWVGD